MTLGTRRKEGAHCENVPFHSTTQLVRAFRINYCRHCGAMNKPGVLTKIIRWSATRFMQRIYRLTHRMPIELRVLERQNVIVMAPHTDDEVISVGGCLALHRQLGSRVLTAYVTSDHSAPEGTPAHQRLGEARAVAEFLRFEAKFLEHPDGSVSLHEESVARDVSRLVVEHKPDVVFAPFPSDHHRDHQAVSAATALGLQNAGYKGEVWLYEIWSTIWPNVAVDIQSVVETKRDAINLYASQTCGMPYAEAALGLNCYRGLRVGVPYAECVYACSTAKFVELTSTLSMI